MKKCRRLVCLLVLISLCHSVMGITAWAQSEFVVEHNMITEYLGNDVNVFVPSQIDGVEILGIDRNAFESCDAERIVLDEGIEVINKYAFMDCINLKEIVIPKSMLLISDYAFSGCVQLNTPAITGEYTVMRPDAFGTEEMTFTRFYVEEGAEEPEFVMEGNTLKAYNGTTSVVEIPSIIEGATVTAIGDSAFNGNIYITEVTIPNTVESIGGYAFSKCTALETVSLPNSLKALGQRAFSECSALKEISIPGTISWCGNYAFEYCGSLEKVVLGEGAKSTGSNTFQYCGLLNDVSLPSTLKTINAWAFGFCENLTSIDIVDGVTLINSAAFYYCKNLNNIYVPDTVTTIGSHCFRACFKLSNLRLSQNISQISFRSLNGCSFETLTIPENVTLIDREAFYQCSKLKYLDLPQNLQTIGSLCFYSCSALETLTIPEKITAIDSGAFNLCSKLTDVYYSGTNEQWKKISIGEDNDCLINATIHYNNPESEKPYTSTVLDAENKIGTISLHNIDAGTIYISKYNGDRFVNVEIRPYTTNSETFVYDTAEGIDTVRIFVWENSNSLVPITEAEPL